ncbi:DNA-directed RNA polymerase subunit alpha [Cognatiyoonia sp. IB215446]|uniref:DNA-directed RNA polymerase subunit alpha n=1 Tax=Cognatiyoonia sp. IB215446 TaxID=3097355 RepID=UPI002A136C42|nr:DNA-directed RNA polymerase subunit alpha [Cognatiyoonia sp. IB215446]MDX8347385.1 DNA-directed RNA polymerase subunit alpha [Cognatiyoonia sp. IB215446]
MSPNLEFTNLTERSGTATLAPLERGFGLTLGNALRRVLMSAIRGAAITSVQIDNVLHAFSEIQGVREDVTDVVLNLKGVAVRLEVDGPKRASIHARGPGVVTAGDISKTSGLTILNEDHVICHLDEGADLYMELTVNTGRGYVSAENNKVEDSPIGLIPIDAIYSPIKKVDYDVQPIREGRVLDYDKLTMRITTDGSIDPREALSRASEILQHQLSHLQADDQNVLLLDNKDAELDYLASALEQPVNELHLSVRSANALRNGDFVIVRDLVEATEAELLRTPNFGRKSLNEIREVLHSMGLHLGMDTAKMSARRHSQNSAKN